MIVNRAVVLNWLRDYIKYMKVEYGVDVFLDHKYRDAAIMYDERGNIQCVRLNADFLNSMSCMFGVNMRTFAELYMSAKHVERHVYQNRVFLTEANADEVWVRMCEHFVIGIGLPEFYWATYSKDPNELDAESWSMRETVSYFNKLCPEFDVDRVILDRVNYAPPWRRHV